MSSAPPKRSAISSQQSAVSDQLFGVAMIGGSVGTHDHLSFRQSDNQDYQPNQAPQHVSLRAMITEQTERS
jgi:hypothetical protein